MRPHPQSLKNGSVLAPHLLSLPHCSCSFLWLWLLCPVLGSVPRGPGITNLRVQGEGPWVAACQHPSPPPSGCLKQSGGCGLPEAGDSLGDEGQPG